MSTDLAVRRTLDLTRAPSEQWNDQMLEVVSRNLFRNLEVTQSQLYFCLSVAESLALNPLVGEIYFIPSRSRDGRGPAWQPYIGRNGLVKKAAERGGYFESETVHAADRFRMARKRDGSVEVTHSYGSADRGEIVGAYAFLHFRNGDRPAFFYAKLSEYLPTFDQEWKMQASPWGNQRSAMIEKCAMIGAGRKRLDLGNVLADGEIERYEQMGEVGPGGALPAQERAEFDFGELTEDAALVERLRLACGAAGWPPAKSEMVLRGLSDEELVRAAEAVEREAQGEVVSGDVLPPEDAVAALERQKARIEDELNDPEVDPVRAQSLAADLAAVERDILAAQNPDQERLL